MTKGPTKTREELLADLMEAELNSQPVRLHRMHELEKLVRAMAYIVHYDKTSAIHKIPWCADKYAESMAIIESVAQKPDNT